MDDESDESLRLSDSEDDGLGTVIQSKDFSLGKNSSSSGVQNVTNEIGSSTTLPSHASQDFTNQLLVSSRGYKNPNLLQPWERGLMAKVFSKSDPVVPFAKLVQPQPFTIVIHPTDSTKSAVVEASPIIKRPVVPFLLRKLRSVDTPYNGDPKALRAINRWRMIVELDLTKSVLGKQITEYVEAGNCDSLIMETLEDALATKSVATSLKRSASIFRYIWWARDPAKGNIHDPLEFREKDCYNYVRFLKDSNSSASSGKTFVQALNFVRYQLGMEQAAQAVSSSRIKGATSKMFRKKKPLNQAPPFTVHQVLTLHHIVSNARDNRDRCKAGYDLMCIYSSCRHDDAMHPAKYILDVDQEGFGFLELHTNRHKVSNTDERRNVFLPLVAVTPGIYTGSSWVLDWMAARKDCGLMFCDMPTMPAPDSKGGWTSRPLGTGESAEWTRELLVAYGNASILDKVRPRTHSGKATVLSWASKYGLSKEVRRCLGHHIERGDSSVVTYSRSALDVPLQQIVKLFRDIVLKKFDPDSSRLIRLKMAQTVNMHHKASLLDTNLQSEPLEEESRQVPDPYTDASAEPGEDLEGWQKVESETEQFDNNEPCANDSRTDADKSNVESSAASGSSSEDSSSESDDSSIDERAAREICIGINNIERPFFDIDGNPLETVQHNKSGVLHCRYSLTHLACTRRITTGFTIVNNLKCKWPVCTQCRTKFPLVTALKPKAKAKMSSA